MNSNHSPAAVGSTAALAATDTLPETMAQPFPAPQRRTGPLGALLDFLGKTLTIAEWEVRKLRHDPTDIVMRAVQPLLWILVFGEVFTRVRAIPTGGRPYLDFMAPGILAQSVLFLSIFYGIAVIWERDLGVIHKFLASPTPRGALVLGKALSAGLRALPQAIIIYLIALVLGVPLSYDPFALRGRSPSSCLARPASPPSR
jgi:ABC-2 type transport system permease protein